LPSAEFVRFCVVGSGGFLVVWGCLELPLRVCGLVPYEGRALSFLFAASGTWRLNRDYTFRPASRRNVRRQWSGYVLVVGVGAVLDYGVYAALIHRSAFALNHRVVSAP